VHVGVETGNDDLLAWLNKPGASHDARALVETLARARLRIALILMVGVGGARFGEPHVRETLDLLHGLPLSAGDIVYLSPFREQQGSAYAARARSEGIEPLDQRALDEQYRALRDGIRERHPAVRATRYDIREFIY
jgi:hypothetical protein